MKPTIGRIVNYVMKDLTVRPMVVIKVYSDEGNGDMINGQLIYDGPNDADNIPGGDPPNLGDGMQRITSIAFQGNLISSNTWHWPQIETPVADPKEITSGQLLELIQELQTKVNDTVEAIKDIHSIVKNPAKPPVNPPAPSAPASRPPAGPPATPKTPGSAVLKVGEKPKGYKPILRHDPPNKK